MDRGIKKDPCKDVDVEPTGGTIEVMVQDREREYGDFTMIGHFVQRGMMSFRGMARKDMTDAQMEAVHQILHKIARLGGNPHNIDTWADIQGYGELGRREAEEILSTKV